MPTVCPLNRTDGAYHQWEFAGVVILNTSSTSQTCTLTLIDGWGVVVEEFDQSVTPGLSTITWENETAYDDEGYTYVINCLLPPRVGTWGDSHIVQTYLEMP